MILVIHSIYLIVLMSNIQQSLQPLFDYLDRLKTLFPNVFSDDKKNRNNYSRFKRNITTLFCEYINNAIEEKMNFIEEGIPKLIEFISSFFTKRQIELDMKVKDILHDILFDIYDVFE